jgi:hypothetical protein
MSAKFMMQVKVTAFLKEINIVFREQAFSVNDLSRLIHGEPLLPCSL